MLEKDTNDKDLTSFYRATVGVALLWTVIVICSSAWNVYNERLQTIALAKQEAFASFNKDQAFRLWGTKHGGVYVPPTAETPPNLYLSHIPDRDITLPSGKRLTLMNPAYMLRQLMADFDELYGIKGRLTSLKPLNPANAPDAWEREALMAFEKGAKEFFVVGKHDGQQSLRLMRPMVVQEGCLKCHAQQGYKEGDIRGGVGVTVPMKTYLAYEKSSIRTIVSTHVGIWFFGLAIIGFVFFRTRQNMFERAKAENLLFESEERFRQFFENAPEYCYMISPTGLILDANRAALDVLGQQKEAIVGKPVQTLYAPESLPGVKGKFEEWKATGKLADTEMSIRAKGGETRTVLLSAGVVKDRHGDVVHSISVQKDITERKQDEQQKALMLKRFTVLWEISRMLDADIKTICEACQLKICEISGSKYAFYGFLNQDETVMTISSWSKEAMAACGLRETPMEYPVASSGLWGNAVRERRAIIVNDYQADIPGKMGLPEGHVALTRLMIIPVFAGKRITALAAVANKPSNYTEEDVSQIEGVMSSVQLLVERKKAEEALRRLNEELEGRVAERTAELAMKNSELEKLNRLFVGRELKMMELKERIEGLEKKLGQDAESA